MEVQTAVSDFSSGMSAIAMVVVCLLPSSHSFAQNNEDRKEQLSSVEIVELVALAGGEQPDDPKSSQALRELKVLGLAKHVVPLLSSHALDLKSIRRQQAAARVLQRGGYAEVIDALGHRLSVDRYSLGDQETRVAYWQLKREQVKAIYDLSGRPCPVADTDSNTAIDDVIPPMLRYIATLKLANARQIALPDDDPRNDVQVQLHSEKEKWLLGEPILLHYEAKNLGAKQVEVSFGGDSRTWPARSLRFKILAIDEMGNVVDDPYPSRDCHGGWGGGSNLQPGQSHWEPIPLWRSCAILQPGVYTIRVYHDLGWEGGHYYNNIQSAHPPLTPHFAPVVETTLTIREPTPQEAYDVVERVLSMPRHPNRSQGERAKPYGDMASITHPIYLPILREKIDQGNHECLEAIGSIPFPAATKALLELTSHNVQEVRQLAIKQLLRRLPSAPRWWNAQRWLAKQSWHKEFNEHALTLSWKLLEREDRESQMQGARILAACGGAEEMVRFLNIFNQALGRYRSDPIEQDHYPRPAHACGALLTAGFKLLDRGASPPAHASQPAEGLMMLKAMSLDKGFRPVDWEVAIASLLKHPIAFVRATAIQNLPPAVVDHFHELIVERIKDRNPPTIAAACHLVGRLELAAAAEPLLEVLRNTKDEWLIGSAYDAAEKCGVTLDRLTEICINRLDESFPKKKYSPYGQQQKLFTLAIKILDYQRGWGSSHVDWLSIKELKPRWQKLLEENRERIKAGERLEIGKPPVTHELFPRGFHLKLNGSRWPNWSEIKEEPLVEP